MKRLLLKHKQKKHTTLLVDFKFVCYRSRYTSGAQLSFNEVNTTINYLTLSTLLSVAKKFNITKCVICADIHEGSIRREEYPEYKNKKGKDISAYDEKMNKIFQATYEDLLGEFYDLGMYPNALPKYEADDVIALYCLEHKENENIIILTKDEDMYQCLDTNVSMYDVDKKIKKTDKWFRTEYGIEPKEWAIIKAMAGCKSDNVEGIRGIGEETALKFIRKVCNPNQEKKINDNIKVVKQCLQVVTLPHPNLTHDHFDFQFKPTKLNKERFIFYCQNLGLRKHLESLHEFETFFG